MKSAFTAIGLAWLAASASAQTPSRLGADDEAAIQRLASRYAETLATCAAEDYADLFAAETGYFASGIRGKVVGREQLITLIESEPHCNAPDDERRSIDIDVPDVALDVGPDGIFGIADLGPVGQYQDEYVKTSDGWRFASRTVLLRAELEAGLDARGMQAIYSLSDDTARRNHYVEGPDGDERFLTAGVAIDLDDDKVTGRVYLKDGGHFDDVYEPIGPGEWRIASRVRVPQSNAD